MNILILVEYSILASWKYRQHWLQQFFNPDPGFMTLPCRTIRDRAKNPLLCPISTCRYHCSVTHLTHPPEHPNGLPSMIMASLMYVMQVRFWPQNILQRAITTDKPHPRHYFRPGTPNCFRTRSSSYRTPPTPLTFDGILVFPYLWFLASEISSYFHHQHGSGRRKIHGHGHRAGH